VAQLPLALATRSLVTATPDPAATANAVRVAADSERAAMGSQLRLVVAASGPLISPLLAAISQFLPVGIAEFLRVAALWFVPVRVAGHLPPVASEDFLVAGAESAPVVVHKHSLVVAFEHLAPVSQLLALVSEPLLVAPRPLLAIYEFLAGVSELLAVVSGPLLVGHELPVAVSRIWALVSELSVVAPQFLLVVSGLLMAASWVLALVSEGLSETSRNLLVAASDRARVAASEDLPPVASELVGAVLCEILATTAFGFVLAVVSGSPLSVVCYLGALAASASHWPRDRGSGEAAASDSAQNPVPDLGVLAAGSRFPRAAASDSVPVGDRQGGAAASDPARVGARRLEPRKALGAA
jgi:hypothetical protein